MKIKRYIAPDIRQAIRMVREELGPDAVIISNKRVDQGIEILAAMEPFDDVVVDDEKEVDDTHQQFANQDANLDEHIAPVPEQVDEVPENIPAYSLQLAEEDKQIDEIDETFEQALNNELMNRSDEVASSDLDMVADIDESMVPIVYQRVDQDNTKLVQLQEELHSLRRLVENQISGLAWNNMELRKPEKVKVLKRFLTYGLDKDICNKVLKTINNSTSQQDCWHQAIVYLKKMIPIYQGDIAKPRKIIALVGPSGVGKTTTIAKLAAKFSLYNSAKKVLLVTADCQRIGAQEQLKVYSRILGIELRILHEGQTLDNILTEYDITERLVLVDTAGVNCNGKLRYEQYSYLMSNRLVIEPYLVLSANVQSSNIEEITDYLKPLKLMGCIITKADETKKLGNAVSVSIKYGLPIVYYSQGQRIPEDLQAVDVNTLLRMGIDVGAEQAFNSDDLAIEFLESSQ